MTNNVKDSPKKRFSVVGDADEDADLDILPDDYEAYRVDSQVRTSYALIDFCFSNGDHQAIAYNHLYEVAFNRSEGLQLTFSEHQVTIHGRRLVELYRNLKRHRVVWIWEASEQEARLADEREPVVTSIEITSRQPTFDLTSA